MSFNKSGKEERFGPGPGQQAAMLSWVLKLKLYDKARWTVDG